MSILQSPSRTSQLSAEPVIVALDLQSAQGRELLEAWTGADDAATVLADGGRYAGGISFPKSATARVFVARSVNALCFEIVRCVHAVKSRGDVSTFRLKLALPTDARAAVDVAIDDLADVEPVGAA